MTRLICTAALLGLLALVPVSMTWLGLTDAWSDDGGE